MESWAYATTPTPVLAFLPSLLATKTNRPRLGRRCLHRVLGMWQVFTRILPTGLYGSNASLARIDTGFTESLSGDQIFAQVAKSAES